MKTDLTFEEWVNINKNLHSLPNDKKEAIISTITKLNSRVRELEGALNQFQYNLQSISK